MAGFNLVLHKYGIFLLKSLLLLVNTRIHFLWDF